MMRRPRGVLVVALGLGVVLAIGGGSRLTGQPAPEARALSLLPIARPDTLTMKHDRTATVAAPGVLANDVDLLGGSKAVLDDGPDHGSLDLKGDGGYTYRPDDGYVGTDTFRYHATGLPSSNTTTVTITITNTVPVATPDAYSVNVGKERRVDKPGVLANDGDADGDRLTPGLVSGPAHGELELRDDGEVRYRPDDGYAGSDAFSYRVWDGVAWSSPATVTLTVGSPAPSPSPSATPPATPTPSPTPSPAPPNTPRPATPTPTPTAPRTPAASQAPTASRTPAPSPTAAPSATATASPSPARSPELGVVVPGRPGGGEPPPPSTSGGGAASGGSDAGPFTVGGTDAGAAIDLTGAIDASVGIELVVPGLLLTVPGLLLVLALLGQLAAGAIWLPLARRWLRGLGIGRSSESRGAGRKATPAA